MTSLDIPPASTSESTNPPILSNDLQREIFEIAALSRPKSIATLMRTSGAVKDWVEPLLYRTIAVDFSPRYRMEIPVFTWDTLLPAIHSKPASFFHHAVRHLFVNIRDGIMAHLQLRVVLSVCTNIRYLALFPGYMRRIDQRSLFQGIAPLPLTHLSTHLINKMINHLGPTPVAFTRLTHLELRTWIDGTPLAGVPLLCENFAQMPQLTHLSFIDNTFLALCPRILETCPRLRVLISLGILTAPINAPDHGDYDDILAELAQDKRFVAMMDKEAHLGDWIAGARAQDDYWVRAEQFIAKRELGEVDALRYQYEFLEEGVLYYDDFI
ncbi:hypothetical protein C8R46DRAFT_1346983 [Mycena filopes]|nr:hypothetical protein C8R46DRAFT_1346983 [Mycena filopes]